MLGLQRDSRAVKNRADSQVHGTFALIKDEITFANVRISPAAENSVTNVIAGAVERAARANAGAAPPIIHARSQGTIFVRRFRNRRSRSEVPSETRREVHIAPNSAKLATSLDFVVSEARYF
jgi:hypothetical protein